MVGNWRVTLLELPPHSSSAHANGDATTAATATAANGNAGAQGHGGAREAGLECPSLPDVMSGRFSYTMRSKGPGLHADVEVGSAKRPAALKHLDLKLVKGPSQPKLHLGLC